MPYLNADEQREYQRKWMSVPRDPRSIHAYRIGKTFRMVVDGQEFPWDITSLSTDRPSASASFSTPMGGTGGLPR